MATGKCIKASLCTVRNFLLTSASVAIGSSYGIMVNASVRVAQVVTKSVNCELFLTNLTANL